MKIAVLFFFIVVVLSCKQNTKENKDISLVSPKEIVQLPETLEFYSIKKSVNDVREGKFKIYTTVDVSCATCLQKIEYWDIFQQQYPQVEVCLVCGSKDRFQLFKHHIKNGTFGKLSVQLLLDYDNRFIKDNSKIIASFSDRCILTDSVNNVIFTGNVYDDKASLVKLKRLITNVKIE